MLWRSRPVFPGSAFQPRRLIQVILSRFRIGVPMNRKPSPLATAIVLALSASSAFAQESAPSATKVANPLDTVIVTGTRVSARPVAESQSPIDIIPPEALQATGTTELATALARALPSLNFPRPAVTDGTSGVRPA